MCYLVHVKEGCEHGEVIGEERKCRPPQRCNAYIGTFKDEGKFRISPGKKCRECASKKEDAKKTTDLGHQQFKEPRLAVDERENLPSLKQQKRAQRWQDIKSDPKRHEEWKIKLKYQQRDRRAHNKALKSQLCQARWTPKRLRNTPYKSKQATVLERSRG